MSKTYALACYKAFGYKYIDENALNSVCFFQSLDELEKNIKICELCNLSKTRINSINLGNINSKIMVVFDSPNDAQNKSGELFTSKAVCKFKDILLENTYLKEDEIYFTFLVKCKTSHIDDHIEKCSPYLLEEISKVKPKIILAMGENVMKPLLKSEVSLEMAHGSVFAYQNSLIMPLFTMEFVQTNPSKKELLIEDIRKLKDIL